MRFKDFLREQELPSYFYTGQKLIDFLDNIYTSTVYHINEDQTVSCPGVILINNGSVVKINGRPVIPYKLKEVHGSLFFRADVVDYSFLPEICGETFKINGSFSDTEHIISHLPTSVGNIVEIYNTITNLHNIHKVLKEVGKKLICPLSIESQVLGVMAIKKVKGFTIDISNFDFYKSKVGTIISHHLSEDRDMLDCKEDLMSWPELKEYAKL